MRPRMNQAIIIVTREFVILLISLAGYTPVPFQSLLSCTEKPIRGHHPNGFYKIDQSEKLAGFL